jgi:hypothetical protein
MFKITRRIDKFLLFFVALTIAGSALLALIVVELYLCSALLPAAWQTAILQGLFHISPKKFDYSVVTHPALGHEIDDMLRKNVGLRVLLYAVILLLLAGNTFLVTRAWKFLRLTSRQGDHGQPPLFDYLLNFHF